MTLSLSYAVFLLAFVVVPLAVLLAAGPRLASRRRRTAATGTAAVLVLALVYTTPWDNYLILRGVWWYGEGTVLARVIAAPIEEYAFIVLQPLLTVAWLYRLSIPDDTATAGDRSRVAGTAAWLATAAAGAVLLTRPWGLYLGAILAWAAPVLALQWAVGGHRLWSIRRRVAAAVAVPTVYLWAIDRLAIGWGLWTISSTHTTGLAILGLPIEEAVFFLVTNLLVVQGVVLYHWVVERWGDPPAVGGPALLARAVGRFGGRAGDRIADRVPSGRRLRTLARGALARTRREGPD